MNRARPILLVWLWNLLSAMIIAAPVHGWARAVWGSHPEGDAVLFRPGGRMLMAWLGDSGPAFPTVVRTSLLSIVVCSLVGQIVSGALIALLSDKATSTAVALRAGAAAFFPMLGLSILVSALQAFTFAVGYYASEATDHGLQASLGDARSFTARLIVLGLFLLVVLALGVIGDLARVVVVRAEQATIRRRMLEALSTALHATRRAFAAVMLGWGWRAAIGISLIVIGSLAGDAVGGRGGAILWGLFAIHQLIVLARAGLRASWLSDALRLTS